jgi:imidazolonepropionase-like amidohydrolase
MSSSRPGFTSTQALAPVTSLAAQACPASDRKGQIAPGYDADLLAVAGNPAADLPAILHPTAIYRPDTAATPAHHPALTRRRARPL